MGSSEAGDDIGVQLILPQSFLVSFPYTMTLNVDASKDSSFELDMMHMVSFAFVACIK